MRKIGRVLVCAVLICIAASGTAQAQRKTPYRASISSGEANMRTGPGRNYPVSWVYRRPDLPIKVVEVYKEWRKIEDPDGTQGWILASLLSDTRTGMVTGAGIAELLSAPRPGSHVQWRVAPGVVGRLSRCERGWCWFDVRGRGGYVETSRLWGVEPGEDLP